MGQKIHPYGLRLGIITDWKARWYSDKDYAAQANEDAQIRALLERELTRGAVSRVEIERIGDKKVQIDIHTARPGVVIGRSGSEVERLRLLLEELTDRLIKINVIEVQDPETDATLLARGIADQLQGRVSFRRAMKRAITTAMKAGAQGVRVETAGRLGGSDMGRREWYREGRVPLHTLRADVDFGRATAHTTVGTIGVKVWVYKGDIMPKLSATREKIAAEAALAAGGPGRRAPAKARAEAAAGEERRGLIEAGGGKRLVEAGGGKRREEGKKRLIEAGGGKRVDAGSAKAELAEAREESEGTLEIEAAAEAEAAATEAEAAATDAVQDELKDRPAEAAAEAEAAVDAEPADSGTDSDVPAAAETTTSDPAPVAEADDDGEEE